MAARTGNLAWRVHFQGLDRNTRIKTGSTVVFDEEGNRLSVPLTMGTDVTYIDNLSGSHPNDSQGSSEMRKKIVAIQVSEETYYVDVNDLPEKILKFKGKKFIVDDKSCSIFYENLIRSKNKIINREDPTYLLKAIKNKTEIKNMIDRNQEHDR